MLSWRLVCVLALIMNYSVFTVSFFTLAVRDVLCFFFFFSSRRRHTRCLSDWSSDVCSSDLAYGGPGQRRDEDVARLGLPPGVHDGTAPATDDLPVPHPRLGVDGLPDRRSEERRVGKEVRSSMTAYCYEKDRETTTSKAVTRE